MLWRDFNKEEPEEDQLVLVIAKEITSCIIPHEYFSRFQSIANYKGNGKYSLKESVYPYEFEVTHWMPLPKYPEHRFLFKLIERLRNVIKTYIISKIQSTKTKDKLSIS